MTGRAGGRMPAAVNFTGLAEPTWTPWRPSSGQKLLSWAIGAVDENDSDLYFAARYRYAPFDFDTREYGQDPQATK